MKQSTRWALAALTSLSLVAAACGGDDSSDSSDTTTAGGSSASSDWAAFGVTEDMSGKKVTIFSSIRDVEAERLEAAWKAFEDGTGIDIEHEPSADFETQLKVRADGGNAPDLAFIPQPGLLGTLAAKGQLKPLESLKADVEANNVAGWVDLGSYEGTFYAPPFGTNVKSFVWYSPSAFAEKGYEIPTTWDEMIALSDEIAADGGTAWCAGIESGTATGWTMTDWMEDAVLRFAGAETYDKWVSHEIPFNDPAILAAAQKVQDLILNEKYVGDVKAIATTSFQNGGLGILDGSCWMHRQASFYGNQFPEGTTKGADGQVNAFYFPVAKAGDPKVMLGGGELIGAFDDRPEVVAVAKFLTSSAYANERLKAGNWLTPNKTADISVITDPLEKTFAEELISSEVFRFDGSDVMPAAVGAGTFWTEATNWVNGKDLESVFADIEASWPSS
jgi:alpha-glucoside transport system substrate-binding protein